MCYDATMSYKYILFDIDNTLIDFPASFDLAAEATLRYGGLAHPTAEDLKKFFEINDAIWFGLELNQSNREDICRFYHKGYEEYLLETEVRVKEAFGLNPSAEELDNVFRRELGKNAAPFSYVLEVLEKLRAWKKTNSQAPSLAVATNGLHQLQSGKLTKFDGLFEEIFISEDLNYVKPEPAYFLEIAKRLNCAPNELLMVGDSLLNDVGGANGAGLDSCFFNPKRIADYQGVAPTYEIADFRELLDIFSIE